MKQMFQFIWKEWWDQWATIRKVPRLVALLIFIGGVGGWILGRNFHKSSADTTISQPNSSRLLTIVSWGASAPEMCSAALDLSTINTYADKSNAFLICGFQRPSVDQFTDKAITVSQPFTIRKEVVQIATPTNSVMLDLVTAAVLKAKPHGYVPPTSGPALKARIWLWYRVALLPKEFRSEDIHQLADVKRLGGILTDDEQRLGVDMPFR